MPLAFAYRGVARTLREMRRLLWLPALVVVLAGCPRSPEPGSRASSRPAPGVVSVDRVPADAAPPPITTGPPSPPLPERMDLGDVDTYTFGIATDATHVYWADYHGGGGVYRAWKNGGGRQKLADAVAFARDVAVDAQFVYVAAARGPSVPPGQIVRVPKAGGVAEVFAASQWNPDRVIVHGGRVLWNANPPGVFLSSPPTLGATPTPVITERVTLVAAHGEALVWVSDAAKIAQSKATGGPPIAVASLVSMPTDIAADDRFVYVLDIGEPIMPRARPCPKNTPCPIATSAPTYPGGSVFAIPLAGGARVPIARDLDWAKHIAVDERYAYVSTARGVLRARKDGGGKIETVAPSGGESRLLVDGDRLIFEADKKIVSLARHP